MGKLKEILCHQRVKWVPDAANFDKAGYFVPKCRLRRWVSPLVSLKRVLSYGTAQSVKFESVEVTQMENGEKSSKMG
jgi:hypothetical protein